MRYQKKNINKSKKKNPQREVDKYRERRLRYIDRTIQRKRERDRENAERERERNEWSNPNITELKFEQHNNITRYI